LVIYSSNRYEAVKNGTNTGALIYTDRNYTLTQLPDYLLTETIIRTACNDKNISSGELISFTAPAGIRVYLAVDKRVSVVPDWMKNWTLTDDELDTSLDDLEFRLYGKSFAKGTSISLGGSQAGGFQGYTASGNYLVFITGDSPLHNSPQKLKNILKVSLHSSCDWDGKLIFDTHRHRTHMNLPFNWARINQFPEWYTVEPDSNYIVRDLTLNIIKKFKGLELIQGIDIVLKKDQKQYYAICPESDSNLITLAKHSADDSPVQRQYSLMPAIIFFSDRNLVVDLKKPAGIHAVNVYNMNGSLLYHRTNEGDKRIVFPVDESYGFYIVRIVADQKIYSEKIVLIP
jgi:hypothetical protein